MQVKSHSKIRRKVVPRTGKRWHPSLRKVEKQSALSDELKNEIIVHKVRLNIDRYRVKLYGEQVGKVVINIVAHDKINHVKIKKKTIKNKKINILDSGDYDIKFYVSTSVSVTDVKQFLKQNNFHNIEAIKQEMPKKMATSVIQTKNLYNFNAVYLRGNGEGGNV